MRQEEQGRRRAGGKTTAGVGLMVQDEKTHLEDRVGCGGATLHGPFSAMGYDGVDGLDGWMGVVRMDGMASPHC